MEQALQRRIQRQVLPAQQRLLEFAGVQPGEKVIDIACGTGLVTLAAARAVGKRGFVLGTDISDNMVNAATTAAGETPTRSPRFARMDAEDLQVADGSFDVALCALGLMYFPNPYRALKEMHRVLKKGGRAVIAVWGRRENCGWAEIFDIMDKRVISEIYPMFFNFGNPGTLSKSLMTMGFRKVNVENLSSTLEYSSGEEACMASFAGGPAALPYHKFSGEIKNEVNAEYLASIKPFQQGNGYSVPGEFVVAMGYK